MKLSSFTLISLLIILSACSQPKSDTAQAEMETPVNNEPPPSRDLGHGFKLEGKDVKTYNDFGVFTQLNIIKGDKLIHTYNNRDEFSLEAIRVYLFPKASRNEFDLLIEGSSPPKKKWMNWFLIRDDSVVSVSKIPAFEAGPHDLDEDERPELAGYWEWFELHGEDRHLTSYNPILYYEVTDNGLILDSALTVKMNTEIFGRFYGYEFSEEVSRPAMVIERHNREIMRIKDDVQ